MNKPTVINQKKYSSDRYYSRYDFLLKHYKAGNILDVGNLGGVFGEGKSNSFYQQFLSDVKDSTVYGFDLFEPKNKNDYPNQKQGNLENELPYADNFFDTVYLGEIIEHLSDFKTALAEIKRVLKTDGVLIIDTPNPYCFSRIAKWLIQREENLGDPTHLVFFTPASLVATLEKNGFTVEIMSEKSPTSYKYFPHFLTKGLGTHLLLLARK